VLDEKNARDLRVNQGEIVFDSVNFSYDPTRPILNEMSFTIKPGEKLAVVGASGAEKSTLARLLFRFYDIDQGSIRIDGQDISHVTQSSLRENIGIVPQDTVLFNETLIYNLQYANPKATRDDIIHAAKLANIHEFIESLPEKYETRVGERGLKLSGGEKQRVAIARVILKNPKILVFDEATSSLDTHSEQAILASLNDAAKNHTTLVIAHRLSTIVDADLILVMANGTILEQGSHQESSSFAGKTRALCGNVAVAIERKAKKESVNEQRAP